MQQNVSGGRDDISNVWAGIEGLFGTFHPGFVGGDGGTLNRYAVFLCSQGGIDGDLVIGLITVRQTQVVIFQLNINIGQDELRTTKHKFTSIDNTPLNIILLFKKKCWFLMKRLFIWHKEDKNVHLKHFF